ncbi:MAG: tandem-95 repeat protein, partial [Chloroflexi bacterium]|nr:tandem-95 repeat protein [Chloroflexota bacterium]
AGDDIATTNEDTPVTVDVLSNDSDVDGDVLSVSAVGSPAQGAATISGPNVVYTPTTNFNGTDVFSYTASDGSLDSNTATVTVTVTAVNDAPVAGDDIAITNEDTPVTVDVLSNDSDVDGDALTISAVGSPAQGTTAISGTTVVYTPTANSNGTDVFTYTVSDGSLTDTATVTVIINAVNDAPVASDDTATTPEDTPATIPVLDNDSDPEGDSLAVGALGSAGHGRLSTNGATITYTPDPNFNGIDSFSYTLSDGGLTDTATVTVTVTAVNDAPDVGNDTATTAEDTAVTIPVLLNDTDVEGDSLTVTAVSAPQHGQATITAANTIIYTPTLNYNGDDSFSTTISDGNGGTGIARVDVTVTPVNDAPIAEDDAAATAAEMAVDIDVLANDHDVDGDTLSIAQITQGGHGTVSLNGDDTVRYRPDIGFSGIDSFSTTITDGHGGSDTAPVTVIVSGASAGVEATDDIAATPEDTAVSILVLDNDSTVAGTLTLISVDRPAHGATQIVGDAILYTPDPDYFGEDSFGYMVSDGIASADSATVTVLVEPVNDAPVALDDVSTLAEDTSVDIAVLANDSDVDGDVVSIISLGQPDHGRVQMLADGAIRYTPDANYNGSDRFTYTIADPFAAEDTAIVSLTVNPVNDASVAIDDAVSTDEDTPIDIHVLANDSDVEGDAISVIAVSPAQHGTAILGGDGSIRYTPDLNYNGSDGFTYTISDGQGGSDVGSVTITINPVDDPPEGVRDATILHTTAALLAVGTNLLQQTEAEIDVLANDVNPDHDQLQVTRVGRARFGRVSIAANGKVKYTPDAGFGLGTDTFTYTVGAVGKVFESVDAIHVVLNPPVDEVIAIDDAVTTLEDKSVTFPIISNDINNATGTQLSLMGVVPGQGTVVVNPDDTVTYSPPANLNGTDVITYVVGNGATGADTGVATVTITPVNDPPDAVADGATTPEDTAVTIDVLANDTDVDGDALSVVEVGHPRHGTVEINPNGSLNYRPDSRFYGIDRFSYIVRDAQGADDIGVVLVSVTPINNYPQAAIDLTSTLEDTPVIIPVLLNDFDPDDDTLSVIGVSQGHHGTVVIDGDNTLTYTPALNFDGRDSFSYEVSDGQLSDTAAVDVSVQAVNDPPQAGDDHVNTAADTARDIFILANDTDVEGDTLSVVALGTPAHGQALLNNDSSIRYTPDAGFTGSETFTYTISDGQLTSTATVAITVGGTNHIPSALGDSVTTDEDTPLTVAVLSNDSDPDHDPLFVSAVVQPGHGIVSTDGRAVVYRPWLNFNGSDIFTYTLSDGDLTATADVFVDIVPVNDPPTARDDLIVVEQNRSLTFDALTNDSDIDGDHVNVSAVGDAGHGTVILQSNTPIPVPERKITYTPATDFIGSDSFAYTLTDGALTATATVSVRVVSYDVNDDGAVDVTDLMLVASRWPSHCGDVGYVPDYDFDGNCTIDVSDIMRVSAAWNRAP